MKGPPLEGEAAPSAAPACPPSCPPLPQNSVGGSHQSSCLPLPPEPHPREPPTQRSACPASSRRALPRAGSAGPTAVGAEGEVRSSSRRCSRRGSEGRPLPGRHRGRGGPVSVRPPPPPQSAAALWAGRTWAALPARLIIQGPAPAAGSSSQQAAPDRDRRAGGQERKNHRALLKNGPRSTCLLRPQRWAGQQWDLQAGFAGGGAGVGRAGVEASRVHSGM